MNIQKKWFTGALFILAIMATSCGSIPGETGKEQEETINLLVERTLIDLYKQDPALKKEIKNSVGYIIMNNKITKIPLVGAGAGYGVAISTKDQARTYLKMTRFDVGGGWGARSLRPVLIFHKQDIFDDFIDGKWAAQAGAEAAAKVGDTGTAGGGNSGELTDKGYSTHVITDAGVSASITAGVIRVKPITLKK